MNHDELAFEYAIGTLRGAQRTQFEQKMKTDPALAADVAFWQQQLMTMQSPAVLKPHVDTWSRIAASLHETSSRSASPKSVWWLPAVLASLLVLAISLFTYTWYQRSATLQLNADYVAVLTDTEGHAKLTALTSVSGNKLWLQWQMTAPALHQSVQLWAISKRDGVARSVAVFHQSQQADIMLDVATNRLIQDAEELLLTMEESGGSAIDEPSDQIVARGVCVRLRQG